VLSIHHSMPSFVSLELITLKDLGWHYSLEEKTAQ
jgi:hypothetical protein